MTATLDEDPRSRVNEIEQSYLMSHKLNPQPLDEGPRPNSDKSRLNLHDNILEGKSIGSNPEKKELKRRELMICRTKMQARVQGRVNSRVQYA
jgi:hypothetical protein